MASKKLSNGMQFLFSEEDRHIASAYSWCYSNGYVVARVPGINTTMRFHRKILAAPEHLHVDHIDGNPLNNCRENLRLTDRSGNMRNSSAKTTDTKTSSYKGVSYCKSTGRWKSQITLDSGNMHVGRFDTEEQAAKAYDNAAKIFHRQYAKLNGVIT
jgi:AP2 domain/HNH endonuclease